MDALFLPLANLVGASVDQIKLIFCLLVAYPLGSLFVRVPSSNPTLRHLFSVGVALFFFFPVLQIYSAFFQLLGSILATYFIAKYDHSSRMPWIVFVIVMGHLTANHIIRAIRGTSYETMEVTGPQMVLTMKLTTFAWNTWDGRRKIEDLDKWQTQKRVTRYPSILEFLGYSFYFPGILVGPFLDFAEYMDLVNETMFKDEKVKSKAGPGSRLPKGRKRAAYIRMVLGLVALGVFVVLGPKFNYTVGLTPEFASKSLLARIALFQIFGPIERAKYYAIWTLTEGASILTGLGFNGFSSSGKPLWDGAANVKVLQIEFPPNFKVLLDSWNMKTNIWLRECVYKRVTPKGKKPGFSSSMITFLTSAFWHGIASGYYLTFFMGGLITAAARLMRSNVRPLFLPADGQKPSFLKQIYDFLGIVTSIVILNYVASPFILLTARDSIATWNRLGWYGHIVILGCLAFFYAGGSKWFKSLHRKMGIVPAAKPTANGNGHALKNGNAQVNGNGKANGNGNVEQSSGASTPVGEKNFVMPPSLDSMVPPPR